MSEPKASSGSEDERANQFMVLDILANLLAFSENPGKMGAFLVRQVRELVGARIVAIITSPHEGSLEGAEVIAFEPKRLRSPETLEALNDLARLGRNLKETVLWQGEEAPGSVRTLMGDNGFNGAIVSPLSVGKRRVGFLVAIHLMEMQRNQDTIRLLEILAPVVALAIQNASFFDSLEARIEARTRDLKTSEKHFQTLAALTPVGILQMDGEGRVRFVNERWRRLTGYEGVRDGHPLADQIFAEDRPRIQGHLEELTSLGIPFQAEFRIGRAGDEPRWVLGETAPERDEAGHLTGWIATLLDIQEHKQAEDERRKLEANFHQAQKLEGLGTLASGVAHDMNNVLGAIHAVTQTLQVKYLDDPYLASSLETIEHAAIRGRDLVKSLTNFARKGVQETRAMDLNLLIRQEVSLLQRTLLQKVKLVEDLVEPLPFIMGEQGTLGSVLMNLCVNAVDAMPDGGTLTLSTRCRPDAWVEMSVQDQGEGMADEVLKRAMEPFFTTKPFGKGTGLGLAMVYNTVKAHGGTVAIRSELGLGTTVVVAFPGIITARLDDPPPAEVDLQGCGSLRILLVDDDELIRAAVPAMLGLFGHTVDVAPGGQAALARLAMGVIPDLLILDLNMPEMGGAETLRRLRKEHARLPVLIATGYLDAAMEILLEQDPFALSITKPFSLDEIRNKLLQFGLG